MTCESELSKAPSSKICRIEVRNDFKDIIRSAAQSYFCISPADVETPLHNSNIMPVSAMARRTFVRVKNDHTALVGGRLAFVDFQVMPPFGRSAIVAGECSHHLLSSLVLFVIVDGSDSN